MGSAPAIAAASGIHHQDRIGQLTYGRK